MLSCFIESTPQIVHYSFLLYFYHRKWPNPVVIKELGHCRYTELHSEEWDPHRNHNDRQHVMPIITPGYPQQNTTANVSRMTLALIKEV